MFWGSPYATCNKLNVISQSRSESRVYSIEHLADWAFSKSFILRNTQGDMQWPTSACHAKWDKQAVIQIILNINTNIFWSHICHRSCGYICHPESLQTTWESETSCVYKASWCRMMVPLDVLGPMKGKKGPLLSRWLHVYTGCGKSQGEGEGWVLTSVWIAWMPGDMGTDSSIKKKKNECF